MRLRQFFASISASLAVALVSLPVLASSHREAPAISIDPIADNTDNWVWVTPGSHDKMFVVAAFNPFEEPAGGPNFNQFSDDVLYEVHVTRGAKSLADVITYQFRFRTSPLTYVDPANLNLPPGGGKEFFVQLSGQKQTYTVTKIQNGKSRVIASDVPVAPPRIGPFTYTNFQKPPGGPDAYDDTYAASFIRGLGGGGEGRVWAGPREDGFYVDLGGVFDAAQLRPKGVAQDGVSGYNCHAIALEIPTTLLTADGKPPGNTPGDATLLGVWTSASRRQVSVLHRGGGSTLLGPWVQVSRLGLPLINEAMIGLQDKDKYNRTEPRTDVANFAAYFLNPVIVRDAEAVGIYAALGVDPTPFKSNRTDILDTINLKNIPTANAHNVPLSATGDVLRLDIATDSGFPNGRPIPGNPDCTAGSPCNKEQADVTDVLLSVLLSKGLVAVKDNVDYNDKPYLAQFPYLALPWEGTNEGHGKPTP